MDQKSILVVDDEAATTLALEGFFQSKGYEVLKAFYGDQAIERIEKSRPAVVVLDLQMPGVDGIGVLEKIRKFYPEMKTLVMTGFSDRYREDLERLKPDAVKLKPISLEELTSAVEALLGEGKTAAAFLKKIEGKVRLLFIEGSEEIYEGILRPYFENPSRKVPCDMVRATTLQEALGRVAEFKPHLVLLDGTRLPVGMDAGKLAGDIRKVPNPPLEVIFHTLPSAVQKDELEAAGCLKVLEDAIWRAMRRYET